MSAEPNIFVRHKDKAWHFLAGMAASFIVATVVNACFWELHDGYWTGLGLGAGAVVGLAKELWDARKDAKGRLVGTGWNWWDLAWTVAGSLFVIVGLRWGWA